MRRVTGRTTFYGRAALVTAPLEPDVADELARRY